MEKERKDINNKKNFTINDGDFSDGNRPVGVDFILENGDELEKLIEKAHKQSSDLNVTLFKIKNFIPTFRLK